MLLSYTKMSCLGKVSIVCHWNFRLFLRLPDSSLEKFQDMPVPPVLFKLLRIGKLARAIRMITMTTMLLSLQQLGWKRGWHKKVIGLLDAGFTGSTHRVVPVEDHVPGTFGMFEILFCDGFEAFLRQSDSFALVSLRGSDPKGVEDTHIYCTKGMPVCPGFISQAPECFPKFWCRIFRSNTTRSCLDTFEQRWE